MLCPACMTEGCVCVCGLGGGGGGGGGALNSLQKVGKLRVLEQFS